MSDVLVFLVFTTIRILSLIFNILLFLVLYIFADYTRTPTVYIYNMLLGNTGEIITGFIIHLYPIMLEDQEYNDFRNSIGSIITLSSTFSYEHPLYLTILMVFQRIFCILKPNSQVFSDIMVWIYCVGVAILSLISLLIPFFSPCRINANQRTSSFEAACAPDRHWITLLQNKYLILIPIISMILNIFLIIYLSLKKRTIERQVNRIGVIRNSNSQSTTRQNFESTLLFQSVSTTTFLLTYELSGLFLRSIPNFTNNLSVSTKQLIFYTRTTTASPLCFLVYFVGTPAIRRLIIKSIGAIFKGITSSGVSSVGPVGGGGWSTGVIT